MKKSLFPDIQPRRTLTYRKLEREQNQTLNTPLPTRALKLPGIPDRPLKIAVLPDTQVAPRQKYDHLSAYGEYIARKQPDALVCLGDFGDIPSLSTFNQPGDIRSEGQRFADDVDCVRKAMKAFLAPIRAQKKYKPRMVMILGNHEDRIDRAIARNPAQLDGKISIEDLGYADAGWTVVPFLQPIDIAGVLFCHYFPAGVMGRPLNTAAGIIRKYHQSAVAGHLQGRDIAYGRRADGKAITAIITGSYYPHDEDYLSPLANSHWRGALFMHEVQDGQFNEMWLSLDYLTKRFAT